MIEINVLCEERAWSKKLKDKNSFFSKICKAFPKKYRFINKRVILTLMLSDNKKIKKLNKKFRNKNKSTDILSFPFKNSLRILDNTYLGDIIISYNFIDKPKSQKLKFFKQKLIKIFIHGFLHLLNFNHIDNKEYKKMIKEEKKIYKSVISKVRID